MQMIPLVTMYGGLKFNTNQQLDFDPPSKQAGKINLTTYSIG